MRNVFFSVVVFVSAKIRNSKKLFRFEWHITWKLFHSWAHTLCTRFLTVRKWSDFACQFNLYKQTQKEALITLTSLITCTQKVLRRFKSSLSFFLNLNLQFRLKRRIKSPLTRSAKCRAFNFPKMATFKPP